MTLNTQDAERAAEPGTASPASGEDVREEIVIEAAPGFGGLGLGDLWRYRELMVYLAWRDVTVRYRQTVLGVAWVVLQPVLMMAVFTYIFRGLVAVATDGPPYPVLTFTGLVPWLFFASAVSNAAFSLVTSEQLLTKVYFPRLALPGAAVLASLVDFACTLVVLAVLMAAYGTRPGAAVLLAPAVAAGVTLTALGAGMLLAALNVTYRDFRYVIPFLVQLWMFATPAVYLPGAGGADVPLGLADLNPMNGFVAAFRACLLEGELPWARLGLSAAVGAALLAAGWLYFRRVEDTFADII